MFYLEISLLRIYVAFLIIRELNKGLCTKIMLLVLLIIVKHWNQNKYFGKIMYMEIMILSDLLTSHGNVHRMREISRSYNTLYVTTQIVFFNTYRKNWITKISGMVYLVGKIMSDYCFPLYALLNFLNFLPYLYANSTIGKNTC